jgi:hypothetical protein
MKQKTVVMDKEDAVRLRTDFFDALRSVELWPSDEMCCEILAWLLVYGGVCEDAVFNKRFNADIVSAQKRLNIYGGEIPNATLLPVLQERIKELSDYYNPPQWVLELERRYKLRNPRGSGV